MNARPGVFGGWRALLVVLIVSGCRHVTARPDTGVSSFAFVEPPPAASGEAVVGEAKKPKSQEQYREAELITPPATPVYPPKALAAKAGRVMVGVHVTVDANGRVTDVVPSVLTFTTPGPFADDFMAAVRVALLQWRFIPAVIEQIELVQASGASYSRVTGSEKTETQFDVSFTFTATGAVLGGTPGK